LISADLQQLADGGELLRVLGAFELVLGSLMGLLSPCVARGGFVGCAREAWLERLDVSAERVNVLLGGVSYLVEPLVMASEKWHGRPILTLARRSTPYATAQGSMARSARLACEVLNDRGPTHDGDPFAD
jgi:hypothetical protein